MPTTADRIAQDLRAAVCGAVELHPEGNDRFRVFTPFVLDDGDHVSPVLKREGDEWVVSDEGNTFMRLSYEFDDRMLQSEGRRRIIEQALGAAGVQDRNGELVSRVRDGGYGDALFSLVQAVVRVMDVTLQTRDVVRSTFVADASALVERAVPPGARVRNWRDPEHDREGHYPVDWRLGGDNDPVFLFLLTSQEKVQDATIVLHQFAKWGVEHRTVGIFEDQERISRRTLARFTDVSEKNFSALPGNEEAVAKYLRRAAGLGTPESN